MNQTKKESDIKWYKSNKKTNDFLTIELVNAVIDYYKKEKPTDQTKLYQALGFYYIKTTNPLGVFSYFSNVEFKESAKPSRKHLSPL